MSAGPLTAVRHAPRAAQAIMAVLGIGVLLLSWRLWSEWRHNPDLSHGLFMPVVFLLLLHDSRASGTQRYLPGGPWAASALTALCGLCLLSLSAAGLYAAALGWTHAVVNFSLTAALVFGLGAALVGFASDSVRLLPFNWAGCVALALWLLSAPIPPGTYARLTLGLQLWVTENVLHALHLLGIAALRHGNVIELAYGSVGIEEACSGVRSLISCVFAGLFFSATLVRRPWARALLVGLSVPLALLMNFIRSLTLTLLANGGVNISGSWHDATGFAVLGVTALLLAGLALLLERREKKSPEAAAAASPVPGSARPRLPVPLRVLAATMGLALALVIFFVANTHSSVRVGTPVPNLYSILPAQVPGWEVDTTADLYQFADILQTDTLAQRTYTKRLANGERVMITLYAAYWRAGQASVSLVASHTPDACWPGSGWEAITPPPPSPRPAVAGRNLYPPEYRLFKSGDFPQHVWFWHLYDGRPIAYRDPYSATELLKIAWKYGFRREGDQLFVRVSSTAPWAVIGSEPLLAQFFSHTQPLGL